MTMHRPPRIDAATRKARARNLRRRKIGPARPRLDAPPTPSPDAAECQAPLTDEERNRLKSGWKFLE